MDLAELDFEHFGADGRHDAVRADDHRGREYAAHRKRKSDINHSQKILSKCLKVRTKSDIIESNS